MAAAPGEVEAGGATPDFAMDLEEYRVLIDTDFAAGLTSEEAAVRLAKYGPNVLTPPPKKSALLAFFQHQVAGFSSMLWIGAVATFIIYLIDYNRSDLILTCALVVLVFGTGLFSWHQEMKVDAVSESFSKMAPANSQVIRDGKTVNISSSELVPGDIVIVTGGIKIPADIRMIEVKGLKVDNSSLTGEPDPLPRSTECTRPDARLETRNLAFLGTNATEGWAKAVVVNTGDDTFMGDIASKAGSNVKPMSLMQIELINFVHIIMYIAFGTGIVFFILALAFGESVKESIISTIGIIVATVPEGLLATVTVAMVITAKQMEKKNVFVKRLDAIETLGAVTAICSDKTGTLTQNRMKVRHVVFHSGVEMLKTLAPAPGDKMTGTQPTTSAHPLTIPAEDQIFRAVSNLKEFRANQQQPSALLSAPVSANTKAVTTFANATLSPLPRGFQNPPQLPIAVPSASTSNASPTVDLLAPNTSNNNNRKQIVPASAAFNPASDDDDQQMLSFARHSAVAIHSAVAKADPSLHQRTSSSMLDAYPADVVMADLVRSQMSPDMLRQQTVNMDVIGRVKSLTLTPANVADANQQLQQQDIASQLSNGSLSRLRSTDLSRPVLMPVQQSSPVTDIPYEMALLIRCAALCNHAEFLSTAEAIPFRPTSGDASETALLRFSAEHVDVDSLRKANPEVACVPFSSKTKFMATVHKLPQPLSAKKQSQVITPGDASPAPTTSAGSKAPARYVVLVKGAFERIVNRCASTVNGLPFDVDQAELVAKYATDLAANGERILGLAQAELDPAQFPEGFEFTVDDSGKPNFPIENLQFIGLTSLEDPPRVEVPGAVTRCDTAGIQVVMVTGDHPLTARSIATQIGIIHADTPCTLFADLDRKAILEQRAELPDTMAAVVTGVDIAEMEEEELKWNNGVALPVTRAARVDQRKKMNEKGEMEYDKDDIYSAIPTKPFWDWIVSRKQLVFARTLPQQKQRIVQEFQRRGHVIAATGDGVNDAPAMRASDVGIAMGIAGTEVAKEAADLVLLDDNFASIVKGVEEGRLIFDNLKKSIVYTLEKNVASLIPFLANVVIGIPLALTPVMILCIDIGTDMFPAIAFAYETPEANIMDRPPADRTVDRLVTRPLIFFAYFIVGVFECLISYVAFFMVLDDYGFSVQWLFSARLGTTWEDKTQEPGTCYEFTHPDTGIVGCADYDYRMKALSKAQTAMFVNVVLCQLAGGVAMKTRFTSVFSHGFRNTVLNWAYLSEICLLALLVYCPGLHVLDFAKGGISAEYWFFPSCISIIVIIFGDELRKRYCFKHPKSLFARLFFY